MCYRDDDGQLAWWLRILEGLGILVAAGVALCMVAYGISQLAVYLGFAR